MTIPWKKPSAAKHLAEHLRAEVVRGRWSGRMPGVIRLADELGVARNTVEAALKALELEGLLVEQGKGRGRRIDLQGAGSQTMGLKVGLFVREMTDLQTNYMLELRHEVADAGHVVQIPTKSLLGLGMDVARVARVADEHEVDAWILMAASREVLEWFAARDAPVFALFGRRRGMNTAGTGPDKTQAMAEATRELIALGHRQIVLITRRMRRLPHPGATEQAFLDALAAGGIEPGSYHLPDWAEHVAGFHERLESMFKFTPPSALILDEVAFFMAAMDFCSHRGIRVPQDISLMCLDASPDFDWCRPTISHIGWDSRPVVRRVLRWVDNISRRKIDLRQTSTRAEFIRGETIGPVKHVE